VYVVATAGHVDHGKSTLVRALTGMEPDRWAEERRRGMTIDLGYAWTTLPSGEDLAFVDVPGHQRFIGNMLAGLGPAPAVLFVVAADEGWRRQSAEHLAAVHALGLTHGLLAVTRSDLTDPAPAIAEAREQLARTSLGDVPAVAVSGRTGQGLPELRDGLSDLAARLPAPALDARIRLWVDRAFTIQGSGTVVTGTLAAGTLAVGDELELDGVPVRVRGLQQLGQQREQVHAVSRVAVNLRGVPREQVTRGQALLSPGQWRTTSLLDVRLGGAADDLPAELVLHLGAASVPVHVRPLGGRHARLSLLHPLPVQTGDRAILRDPGRQAVADGVLVLDAEPAPLGRRGDAARRAAELASQSGRPDLLTEVRRRGAVRRSDLTALGLPADAAVPHEVREAEDWLVHEQAWNAWVSAVAESVRTQAESTPLEPTVSLEAARRAAGVPDARLVPALAVAAGLEVAGGRLQVQGGTTSLGPAEPALRELELRLAASPFVAPERDEMRDWQLGRREVAAAEKAGRLLRLDEDIVLLPSAPALAMRELARLPQPFTLSEARQALGTTRRVAVPLMEHLDRRGWTRRVDATHRTVVRPG
jgi:selenocysteine-specific elongation factor